MGLTCRQNAKVKEMFKLIEKLQVSQSQKIYYYTSTAVENFFGVFCFPLLGSVMHLWKATILSFLYKHVRRNMGIELHILQEGQHLIDIL